MNFRRIGGIAARTGLSGLMGGPTAAAGSAVRQARQARKKRGPQMPTHAEIVLNGLKDPRVQDEIRRLAAEAVPAAPALAAAPDQETFIERVQRHEGEVRDEDGRHKPYKCPAEYWTTGWGHNLQANHPGEWRTMIHERFTDEQCEEWLEEDLEAAQGRCRNTARRHGCDLDSFPEDVQEALVEMAFQLGNTRAWRNMWEALRQRQWISAARHALDSKWFRNDTPERALETAHLLADRQLRFELVSKGDGTLPATFRELAA